MNSKLFLRRNASTILTYVGAAGVVGTSVLAVRATPKAMLLLEDAKSEKGEELTNLEKFKVAGPVYIPAILVGASTISCIFGANVINQHQQAAVTSALVLVDNAYKEYREKVKYLYGVEADNKIMVEVAKDKYPGKILIDGSEDYLFYDEYSGRYFTSTMTQVKQAECDLNIRLGTVGFVDLNEWYELVGLDTVEYAYYMGWSVSVGEAMDSTQVVDFSHEIAVMEDGLECCIISMPIKPYYNFMELTDIFNTFRE